MYVCRTEKDKKGGKPASVRLTSLFDLLPHFSDLAFFHLGRGGIEAADFVVFFVGEHCVGEGRVLGFGHFVLGDGREGR